MFHTNFWLSGVAFSGVGHAIYACVTSSFFAWF